MYKTLVLKWKTRFGLVNNIGTSENTSLNLVYVTHKNMAKQEFNIYVNFQLVAKSGFDSVLLVIFPRACFLLVFKDIRVLCHMNPDNCEWKILQYKMRETKYTNDVKTCAYGNIIDEYRKTRFTWLNIMFLRGLICVSDLLLNFKQYGYYSSWSCVNDLCATCFTTSICYLVK